MLVEEEYKKQEKTNNYYRSSETAFKHILKCRKTPARQIQNKLASINGPICAKI